MGVLPALCSGVTMQEGALAADGGPRQLHLAHQARSQYAGPVYKALQAALQAQALCVRLQLHSLGVCL